MSLAIAVRIAGSSVRSIAGRPPAAESPRRRPSRRSPSRRCRARAASRRARSSRAARRRGRQHRRVVGQRLLPQRADLLRPSSAPTGARPRAPARGRSRARRGTDTGSSRRRRRARGARCGPRAARGARRTRARAPTARGRASRPAPGGRTDQLVGGSNSHSAPAGANAIVRQPRARAPSARDRVTAVLVVPKPIAMSSGRGDQRDLRGQVASLAGERRAPAALACRRSPDGRTRPRRGARPTAPPASDRTRSADPRGRTARPSDDTVAPAARPPRRRTARSPRVRSRAAPEPAAGRRQASRLLGGAGGDPQQPVAPRLDSLAGPRAQHDPSRRRDAPDVDVVEQPVEVEVEVRQQVDLVDEHELAGAEHQRVLERLVLALGHRAHHHARVLADPELGRADEVADVLDDQQIDLVERQRRDRRADHVGVEVTLAAEAGAGVELGHRHVQAGQAVGVHRALRRRPRARRRARREDRRRRARAASSCRRRERS